MTIGAQTYYKAVVGADPATFIGPLNANEGGGENNSSPWTRFNGLLFSSVDGAVTILVSPTPNLTDGTPIVIGQAVTGLTPFTFSLPIVGQYWFVGFVPTVPPGDVKFFTSFTTGGGTAANTVF